MTVKSNPSAAWLGRLAGANLGGVRLKKDNLTPRVNVANVNNNGEMKLTTIPYRVWDCGQRNRAFFQQEK
ncbi:hypothetical protein AUJ69_01035 [Candidatus Woesearchaeota archaeon CG1_02_47_18]|nr:MAG: hypothetical protein AUJ69_01035 [Candidatus Woesearchaeota archaeon CG1_02_47_18]